MQKTRPKRTALLRASVCFMLYMLCFVAKLPVSGTTEGAAAARQATPSVAELSSPVSIVPSTSNHDFFPHVVHDAVITLCV
jgi:hypothetical protein